VAVRAPTRHGVVAAGLALVALVAGAFGVEVLHADLAGATWNCWTF